MEVSPEYVYYGGGISGTGRRDLNITANVIRGA
jgi:hypothetical protein